MSKIIEMPKSVMSLTANSEKMFFGGNGHGIARYDIARYPVFLKLNAKMQGFFWKPTEIDMSQEKRSFDAMTKSEKHLFTSNLKRQILLDSIQGRAPSLVFLPYCTDPALENCIITWGFMESIHSESYTHIIRAIYPDPSEIFEDLPNIAEIADCATSISAAYDNMVNNPSKQNLYLALIAANALEAIRFYVSFACTFSFLDRAMVEGSAKNVKFIARDETQHLALTQHILKLLPEDDPEFKEIILDNRAAAEKIFLEAAEQEKLWAKYLFKNGPVIALNEKILSDYVDYLLARRMHAVGLKATVNYKGNHPLPWIEKHFNNSSHQVAPQETELVSYLDASTLNNDIKQHDFTKWSLD